MIDIWAKIQDQVTPSVLEGELVRIVENQEQIATNQLVDEMMEQHQLEQLLDKTKPPAPDGLHYLLSTPFRYPPLKYGSRFGTRFEPSLFYGSKAIVTAMAETAYYRFRFWYDLKIPFPSGKLKTEHTAFTVSYRTALGLQLQHAPFKQFQDVLTSTSDYSATQKLGHEMRTSGVLAFEYVSARCLQQGINVALFHPDGLASTRPTHQDALLADTSAKVVSFLSQTDKKLYQFKFDDFAVKGQIPIP